LATTAGCHAFPKAPTTRSAGAARQFAQQGLAAMERSDWTNAEKLLFKAVEACPADVEARRNYAETLWHRGAYAAAIAQLEEARRVATQDAALAVRVGELYLNLNRLDKARLAADQALDLDPKFAPAWALRGRVLELNNQPRAALADYQRALGYDPANVDLQLRLAESYRQTGSPSRALAALQNLLEVYPPGEEPQNALYLQGLALSALGRFNEAADSYARACGRGAPTAELLCRLGEAQWMAGRPSEAGASVQQALALEPAHPASVALARQIQLASAAAGQPGQSLRR
jgi:tetratricopeptide (TPR) repeat protein